MDSACRAESIDINFIAQKANGVSKNHDKLHENLPIFLEQTLALEEAESMNFSFRFA